MLSSAVVARASEANSRLGLPNMERFHFLMQIPLCSFSACNAFAHVYVMSASRPICESAYLKVVSREHFSDSMTITVMMVAEKPSLAASIAQHLSGGKVTAFLP